MFKKRWLILAAIVYFIYQDSSKEKEELVDKSKDLAQDAWSYALTSEQKAKDMLNKKKVEKVPPQLIELVRKEKTKEDTPLSLFDKVMKNKDAREFVDEDPDRINMIMKTIEEEIKNE